MLGGLLSSLLLATAAAAGARKPNIILILTDDQDVSTMERRFLPQTFSTLVDHGLSLTNFFTPVSHAHNHNVTFVSAPWGGWDVFNDLGYVGHTLPDFLQRAGYDTFYTGKYMNAHTEKNCETKPVSGFTSSDFLVDPYTYDYWTPGFSRDNGPVKVHKGEYSTDLVRDKALSYLQDGINGDKPFFLGIAPIAPHSWIPYTGRDEDWDGKMTMHIPATHPRHANLFPGEQVARSASFNPDEPHGVSWVRTLPKLNATQEAYIDEFHRGRLRALQAVDELVGDVVRRLEEAGELENTYIFYIADNGYALGTHRRQPGKTLSFEEDIHVPFIARGPGIPHATDTVASYGIVDLSRTILDIAGAKADYEDDGVRIDLHQPKIDDLMEARDGEARHSLTEYWVLGGGEGIYGGPLRTNNTYRTVRVSDQVDGKTQSYSYSVWCTGERELYDLEADPLQIDNLLAPLNAAGPFANFALLPSLGGSVSSGLLHRLDGLLLLLKTCVGDDCRRPWAALFPSGEVSSLQDALHARFDAYFANLPRVQYDKCVLGYLARVEQPEWKGVWAYGSEAMQEAAKVPGGEGEEVGEGEDKARLVVQA